MKRGKKPKQLTRESCIRNSLRKASKSKNPIREMMPNMLRAYDLYKKGQSRTEAGYRLGLDANTAYTYAQHSFIAREAKTTYLPNMSLYDLAIASNLSFKSMCRLYAIAIGETNEKQNSPKA